MTQEELNEILEKHKKWLNDEDDGERANLRGAYLRGDDLSSANLRGADLRYANLRRADLRGADLRGANLTGTELSGADLRYADLTGANLTCANLSIADLLGADLTGANLRRADLDESEKIRQGVCLEESMTGYKKCENGVIVTLEIPAGAIVFSINNSKCRTNVAKVIDIDNGLTKVASCYYSNFIYRKGRIVRAKNFNCQYNEECANGIHFFRTREEAEKY